MPPEQPPTIGPDHLGDGVYATFDGYHIILDLRGQDSYTRIALEPQVLEALDRYRERCRRICEALEIAQRVCKPDEGERA